MRMKWTLIYVAALLKPPDNLIQASWLSRPYCLSNRSITMEESRWYCSQFVLDNFPQVNITTVGDSQKPRSLSFGRAFFMSANIDMVHFFIGSQKPFVCSSPSRCLTKSSKATSPIWDALQSSTSHDAI